MHISTDEVFGSLGPEGLFCEDTPYSPNSPYSASKAGSDHLVRAWRHTYGLPTIVTNCSNNYGPYHFPEKLIPLMILNAIEGKPLPVYGRGENIRDWLYVEDHAAALISVARRGWSARPTTSAGATNGKTSMSSRPFAMLSTNASARGRTRPHHFCRRSARSRSALRDRRAKIERELGWRPPRISTPVCARPSSGISKIAHGGGRCGGGYRGERLGADMRTAALGA